MPSVVFLFTLDQIAFMLNIEESTLRVSYLYYVGRTTGAKTRNQMDAINIADDGEKPDWRVSHQEFVKWCRRRNITLHTFSTLSGR